MLIEWLAWRATKQSLRQDAGVMETTSHLKLGIGYGLVLREFSEVAGRREYLALTEIQKKGVKVLGAKEDQGEVFVMWQHRSRPEMFRICDRELQSYAQKNLDGLLSE